jgi:hypothetical protein
MTEAPIQSLWIGPRLTTLERLSITSFLRNGHAYHLYCYDHVDGIPEGTVVKDGRDILAADRLFVYSDGFAKGSHAAFSNAFRYRLLFERGGWWTDTDVVCLRPFTFAEERVLSSEELDPPEQLIVASSVIKMIAGDPLMRWACDACDLIDTSAVQFGMIGPRLLQAGVDALQLHSLLRPHTFFSPVAHFNWRALLDPRGVALGTEVFAVHLWNQRWNAEGVNKDDVFPDGCFYEQMKRRFLS